jgi:hypothetical protein
MAKMTAYTYLFHEQQDSNLQGLRERTLESLFVINPMAYLTISTFLVWVMSATTE